MSSPMDRATTENKLMTWLIDNSNAPVGDVIDPDENLLDTGILDSLGIAEATEYMEQEFDIVIDEDEISATNYGTLKKLTDFCMAKGDTLAA